MTSFNQYCIITRTTSGFLKVGMASFSIFKYSSMENALQTVGGTGYSFSSKNNFCSSYAATSNRGALLNSCPPFNARRHLICKSLLSAYFKITRLPISPTKRRSRNRKISKSSYTSLRSISSIEYNTLESCAGKLIGRIVNSKVNNGTCLSDNIRSI